MWFISRCISIDSLNSCLQQQKNKLSYDFCLCREKSDAFTSRNDEDDCEPLTRKSSRNNLNHHRHDQHNRRRIPKRYSNIIGSFGTKRKDSINCSSSQNDHSFNNNNNISARHSTKSQNEKTNCFNLHKRRSHEIRECNNKHEDILAHRMQAAMSSELMHSLNRNFVFGNLKQSITDSPMIRSYSLNICTCWNEKLNDNSYNLDSTNVKLDFDNEMFSIELPTPDYDEINDEIILKPIQNDINTSDEPAVDYDDSKPTIQDESDDKLSRQINLEILSSCVMLPISTEKTEDDDNGDDENDGDDSDDENDGDDGDDENDGDDGDDDDDDNEEKISISPSLLSPNLITEQQEITIQCRTIAAEVPSDHQFILKDVQDDEIKSSESLKASSSILRKPRYINATKRLKYGKMFQSLSCSNLSDSSMAHISNCETNSILSNKNLSATDEKILDRISLSSPGTSIDVDHEHRSSSSKVYNDYKKQASVTSVLTNTIPSHSIIIQPMQSNFGLRSTTSSGSTNEKLADMSLSSKQMNVCVINQLNEHLSTRFRQQQQEICSNNINYNIPVTNNPSKDPSQASMSRHNNIQSNMYDEPKYLPRSNSISSSSINTQVPSPPLPPPPPPPLPVGGFPPIAQSIKQSSTSYRNSTMALGRESINSNIPSSTIGSTVSSNLSDTRILRELRENPLFARAKEQLEIAPGSNGRRAGRRLIGSTSNIANTESLPNDTLAYIRSENYSKANMKKSNEIPTSQQLETIIINSDELNAILGNKTKAITQVNLVKPRPCTKSVIQTQCRQSELELIFQKRAQRSEQNQM